MQDSQTTISPARETPVSQGLLDRAFVALVRWDVEKLAWAALLVIALLSRTIGLGDRAMSHDESLHSYYSWKLYDGQGFQHQPLMHGPLKFIVNAFMYFIFGVNDWSARIQVALFGVLMVGLVWLLRPWLGRVGAFLAAVMFTISPALLFHSRYIRDEVILCALLVLLVVAMFRYLATRQTKWLIWTAAALGLALTTMEASFIFGGIFGIFLLLALATQLWLLDWPDGAGARENFRRALSVGLPALVAGLIFLVFKQKGPGIVFLGIGVLAVAAAAILVATSWRARLRTFAALDMIVLLLTLVLPFLSAVILKVLGWQISQFTSPGAVTLANIWQGGLVLAAMFILSIAIGAYWLRGRWFAAAGLFWAIEVLLFTTLLTNGQGIATGLIGSLGYWIDQQEVMRGGQPWYYFFLLVPLYEFLPMLLAIIGTVAWFLGAGAESRAKDHAAERQDGSTGDGAGTEALPVSTLRSGAEMRGPSKTGDVREAPSAARPAAATSLTQSPPAAFSVGNQFVAFLVFWEFAVWLVFTYVGEKMPWHVVYFATPMALLGGWWLGRVIESIDWGAVRARGGFWLLAGVPVFFFVLKAIFPAPDRRPFAGLTTAALSNTAQWLLALIVGVALVWLGYPRIADLGWRLSRRLIVVALAGVLAVLTVNVAFRFAFVTYDYATEPMVYAHATPDIKLAMSQIDEISRKIAGDHSLKVAYDDDSSWPLLWYLRDYNKQVFYGANPTKETLDAPVVIAGDKNIAKVKPYLGDRYYEFSYRLIWWPSQTYFGLNWQRIWDGIKDPKQRGQFWDVVINRRYTTPNTQWSLVHRFSLFVRKDVAAQVWDWGAPPGSAAAQAAVDPYLKGQKDIAALQAIGTAGVSGTGAGQLSSPRAVAVAADGTVYVADSGNNRVAVFGADGKFIRQWGSPCKLIENNQGCQGDGHGQFNEPWGIAVGSDGSVYVADTWNSRVQKFDREGNFAAMWGVFQSTNGELTQPGAMYGPRAIAVGQDGLVYVMDTGNKRVQSFKADGTFVGQYGGGGVVDGKFDEPVGLAQDGSGNWYVTDTWNHRVQKFDAGWNYVGQWAVNGWGSQSVVNKPYLAVDAKRGLVYTTDPEGYRVLVFGTDGSFKGTWGQFGQEANTFTLPTGIAVAADGKVYVADGGSQRIMIFPAWQ